MFKAVSTDVSFPKQEEEILEFWKREGIYQKTLDLRADGPPFVFYEGPPTANGMPHPGHCLTRAIKDLFPRYRTMRGYRCDRKAGWDTHGLPVEVEVCKEIGIHGKEEIEAFGIEAFIQKCQQSVWRYMQEWERLTERIGFWIDLSQAYVTYHQSYVESVWWSLKNLFDRGLLYRGHKIVWWWAQGGTALSSGEVGEGYREVADPSVYVRFPLEDEPKTSLVVWTTTPWTLPSNQFAAVSADIPYAYCREPGSDETLIIAEALVETLAEKIKKPLEVIKTVPGSELVGKHYRPPFDYYWGKSKDETGKLVSGQLQRRSWRVLAAPFVTTDSGTGIVHLAPAFGEDDYQVLIDQQSLYQPNEGPKLICAVGSNGKFTKEVPDYEGVWVKDADKAITRRLRDEGSLFHQEQYVHQYPFCWRASSDPLIQYPRESWFIRTTEFRDEMLANNQKIGWSPEHIRDGRFGNFLESNVDWALSRERYWGTPLPIWVCDVTGKMDSVGSYDELLKKPGIQGTEVWLKAKEANPELVEDLKVHKPYIDAVTYQSPFDPKGRMKRVTEVIDCWYDSGAMPFAQWGYPHQNQETFAKQFPADFISEALDQTRGWFYSQLAISTMLFGESSSIPKSSQHAYPHPFRNCIVLGLMLAEWYESKDGKQRFLTEEEAKAACGNDYVAKTGKMSKSLRNYRSPNEIFDRFGADALRWYFFANQPPWNSIVYSERAIRDSIPEFILRLWNVFSFFSIYAEIDGFAGPTTYRGSTKKENPWTADELRQCADYRPIAERSELDRWMMSELSSSVQGCIEAMDRYDNYGACQILNALVEGLSNWFVRRSRSRYWAEDKRSQDKLDAYWTLYESMLTITKLIAPFVPFLAEALWKKLTACVESSTKLSVHLCDYPTPDESAIDRPLGQRMKLLREIGSLGRAARMEAKLKVRQPLSLVEVILAGDEHQRWLEEHDDILKEELNVKAIRYSHGSSPYIEYQVQPNFRKLGPKLGPLLPKVKQLLGSADGAQLMSEMNEHSSIRLQVGAETVVLDGEDIQVRLNAKPGWAASQGKACVVVLATELTESLIREGIAKDLIRGIQDLRKKTDCQFTDRIAVVMSTDEPTLVAAVEENRGLIMSETLCTSLDVISAQTSATSVANWNAIEVGDLTLQVSLQPIR